MKTKVIALEVQPGAYSMLKFQVGKRDAVLVLPVGLDKLEQADAVRELGELLEVVRGFAEHEGG